MKRILLCFLSLCIVFSALHFDVWAEPAEPHTHCACSGVLTGENCAAHDETVLWQEWTSTDSLPTTSGNYYLSADVQLKGANPEGMKIEGKDVNLCLNGHNISLAKSDATISYRISVWDAASKLTIMDCQAQLDSNGLLTKGGTISGSDYGDNGPIYARGGSLTLIGVQISDNTNKQAAATYGGGAIQIRNGAQVTTEHVAFIGNTAASDGGAVCIKKGTLTAKNTIFADNTAGIQGGAIYLENNTCSAQLENCRVTDNTASGAAIHLQGATATLSAVTMTGNRNIGTGGGGSAVHTAAGGKATLQDCTITGNQNTQVSDYAGGVYLPNKNSSITVCGSTVISGNTVGSGKESNAYLQDAGAKLTIGALTEGAKIHVTTRTPENTDNANDFLQYLDTTPTMGQENGPWIIYANKMANGEGKCAVGYDTAQRFFFTENTNHKHAACSCTLSGNSAGCTHTELPWLEWTSTTSLPTEAGNYYLSADVQLTGTEPDVRISGEQDVKICLNGHSISLAKSDSNTSYRISVWDAASKLTIMDCQAQLDSNGLLTKGGKISGSDYGTNGAIYARGGELTLIGVEISGNTNAETTATYGGGAMQIRNGAQVTAEHVTFSGNTAGSDGGAICIKSGALTARNTVFTGNTAGISGGAIFLENDSCTLTVSGNTGIYNNTADNLYLSDGAKLTVDGLTDGTRIGVTTQTPYQLLDDPDVFMTKAADIADWDHQWVVYENISAAVEYSEENGFFFDTTGIQWHTHCACSGVLSGKNCESHDPELIWQEWKSTDSLPTTSGNYYLSADVQLTGAEPDVRISGEQDVKICLNGHSISLAKSDSDVSYRISVWDALSKLTIMDCQAQLDSNGLLTKGGKISGSAYGTNGAIYARGGELTLIGVEISGNTNAEKTATFGGGAMQIRNGAQVTAEHVTFSGNTAGSDGGAVCIKNGALTARNTVFTGNTAGISGGAIFLENDSCTLTVSGNTGIYNNTADNLYLSDGAKLTVDGLTDGARIGVTTQTPYQLLDDPDVFMTKAADIADWDHQWVVYENISAAVEYSEENGFFFDTTGIQWHTHCACSGVLSGKNCESHDPELIWQEWKSTDSLPTTSGNYYLSADVQLTGAEPDVRISGEQDVKICLNGHNISLAKSDSDVSYRISVWDAASKLTIMDCQAKLDTNGQLAESGTISGSAYGTNGAIYARGGELTLIGVEISGNTNAEKTATFGGGAMQIRNGAQVTAEYVTFSGNTAGSDGGAICIKSGTLTARNTVFTGNTAGISGGAIYLENNTGSAQLENCLLEGNSATGQGSALYCGIGSMLSAANTTIRKHEAAGAAVHLNGANASFTKAVITDNVSTVDGGSAIHVANGSTCQLRDCTVTGNQSPNRTEYCGGIYVPNSRSRLTISGCMVIDGNTVSGGKAANLFLQDAGTQLTVGQLTDGSRLGITTLHTYTIQDDPDAFLKADKLTTWDSQWVTYENALLNVDYSAKENFFFLAKTDHSHCLCNNAGTIGCDHAKAAWLPWETADKLPTNSGYYYLTTDVTLSSAASLKASADVKLCLNGKTVTVKTQQDKDISSIYQLSGSARLSISDCTGSGKLTGAQRSAIWLEAGQAQFNLYGGTITGNHCTASGGAIRLNGSNTFNMYGGSIEGNSAITAGGLYVNNDSVVNMYGGIIKANTARDNEEKTAGFGGAMLLVRGGTLNLQSGTITENTAQSGGAIYATGDAKVHVLGGQISKNTASVHGGAIGAIENSTVTVTGGTLDSNKATTGNGGAIYAEKTAVELSDGTISGNTATMGGGLYLGLKTTLTMTGGQVCKNTAVQSGGGIQHYLSTGSYTGGQVAENVSQANGGGLCTSQKCELTVDGATVTGNTAKDSGGGVLLQGYDSVLHFTSGTVSKNQASMGGGLFVSTNTTLHMTGGQVCKNTAVQSGGGIQHYLSTGSYTGGQVAENVSQANGGGLCTSQKCKVTLDGITISGNTAKEAGGGILLQGYESQLTYTSGEVSNNRAKAGGGLYISTNTTLTMTGGRVRSNYASETGGGIQQLLSTGSYTGGTIESNTSGKNGGGLCTSQKCQVTLDGITIAGNSAKEAGGGVLLQGYYSVMRLRGGTVQNNTAQTGGGMYISTNTTLTMTGGTISGNTAQYGSGVQQLLSTANYRGGSITNNTATVDGGGIRTTQKCTVCIDGTKISNNRAQEHGGGVLIQGYGSTLQMASGEISGNTATLGAGLFGSVNTTLDISGGSMSKNAAEESGGGLYLYYTSANIRGMEICENTAKLDGGGLFSEHANVQLCDLTIRNNTAGKNGGGMRVGQVDFYTVQNVTLSDNTAKESGGGMYLGIGSTTELRNVQLTQNKAGTTGGGLYAIDDLTMIDLTATGNTSGTGGAVYLDESFFDGRSYFAGLMLMAGNMRICDNSGSPADLFIGKNTTISVTAEGLGKDTKIHVNLAEGVLTNTVFGAYDYEGGNLDYVITYGDRSLHELEEIDVPVPPTEAPTEPEETPSTEPVVPEETGRNALPVALTAIGAAVIAAALAVILALKKKKSTGSGQNK